MLFRNVYEIEIDVRMKRTNEWAEEKAELNECAVRVSVYCRSMTIEKFNKRDEKTIFIKSYVIWKWRIFTVEMRIFRYFSDFQLFTRPIKGRFYCVNIVMNLHYSCYLSMELTSMFSRTKHFSISIWVDFFYLVNAWKTRIQVEKSSKINSSKSDWKNI